MAFWEWWGCGMLSILGGVKQGVLAAKPEELILGAYNTPSFSFGC